MARLAEDVEDDPFSDRKHGPRTRAKANKEEKKQQFDTQKRIEAIKAKKAQQPIPTSESFARLRPAAFPTLDTSLTIEQNERILEERDLIEFANRPEINPFFVDEEDYFFEVCDPLNVPTTYVKPPSKPEHDFNRGRERTLAQSLGPTNEEEVIENSVRYHTRGNEDPFVYKTFLTRHLETGKVVRWYQVDRKKGGTEIPNLDGAFDLEDEPESSLPSLTPDCDSDSDSESDSGEEPYIAGLDHVKATHPLLAEYIRRKLQAKMAENTAPAAAGDDATRGMPYYERLKKTLKVSIKQKQELEDQLANIERSIWNKEAAYLDDTVAGNIMKGFDNYIKASGASGGSMTGGGTASRKKATVSEQDRLFSRSSVGFWSSMREGSPHASATSTPSHAPTPKGLSDHPTPTSTTSTKAPGLKKKKAADKDDESDGKPPNKRLKITFSRTDKD